MVCIKELDLNIINPTTENYRDGKRGGSKIVVIGKGGTGKTTLIKSILYHKKHIFPMALVISGTEESNHSFSRNICPDYIYDTYDEDLITNFITRQKAAKKHLKNPWSVLILDDCTDDPKIFNRKIQLDLYKNGRHYNMLYILALQYCSDIKPAIRTNIDGVFILRDPLVTNRKKIWENYASIIPTLPLFCKLMDSLTEDYCSMFIDNTSKSNNWEECVYYYKPSIIKKPWKFGSDLMWEG